MALAEDVLGILDELRRTDGKLKRARIIGRLWSAARKLPGEERKQLAAILADRYAPALVAKLDAGDEVQSNELLGMIRAVGSVDADEITEIMERLSHPEERRQLLTQVAESLQDDIADADIEQLVDDPAAATAALAAAAHELAGDLDVVRDEPDRADEAPPEALAPIERAELGAPEVPDGDSGKPADATDDTDEPATAPEPEAVAVHSEASEENTAEEAPPAPHPDTGAPIATAETGPIPGAAAMPDGSAITAEELESIPSPVARLRTLSLRLEELSGPFDGPPLAASFPDGWQRRRAVAAMCRSLPPGEISEAAAIIVTLTAPMQRRWVVRTLVDLWDLSAEEVARLAAATDLPASAVRLAPLG